MGHKSKQSLSEIFMILMLCAYFLWQTSYAMVTKQGVSMTLLFYTSYQWELPWDNLGYDLEIVVVNYLKH